MDVELRPAGSPQIAVWLETETGVLVDTLMVTRLVGTFGLGNRPGRSDFGHGYLWPYGRREMALPVWAHKRGVKYDRLVFQDCKESALGWHELTSSLEPFYCRPMTETEMSVDTITCPTTAFRTDKGVPLRLLGGSARPECRALVEGESQFSYYPPRNDLVFFDQARDWEGVPEYRTQNALDAVSQATPNAGQIHRVRWVLPAGVPAGRYFVYVEVNEEYDQNAHHDYSFFVDPALSDYGIEGWGQPSVVFRVALEVGDGETAASGTEYLGYGAYDGQDGLIRPADGTITVGVPGSGEGRLLPLGTSGERVRVRYDPDAEGGGCPSVLPAEGLFVSGADFDFVEVTFSPSYSASRYEVRYAEGRGAIRSDEEFNGALPGPQMTDMIPGEPQSFRLDRLRAETTYTVAVRAYNDCLGASEVVSLDASTERRVFATVDACFIATAAHGSMQHEDVVALRRFRDQVLMQTDTGRAFVSSYYEHSPALADRIRESEGWKAVTRAALAPIVGLVKTVE